MIKFLLRLVRQTFYFSYSEARGFLLMVLLLLSSFIAYLVYKNLPDEGYSSYGEDKELLDSLVDRFTALESQEAVVEKGLAGIKKKQEINYFSFDPNSISPDSLHLLGVPDWLARRISNYRQRGGSFRKEEDLLKIYDFPDSLYRKLKPFIRLKTAVPKKEWSTKEEERNVPVEKKKAEKASSFDLNQADSLQLQQISGIGPVLSGRIIRFRNVLGGFAAPRQVYEVYGLDTAVAKKLLKVAFIAENFRPEQIQLNTASREELMAHPYISPAQARFMLAYREQHGPFQEVDDLLKIHTFDVNFVQKIAPYVLID